MSNPTTSLAEHGVIAEAIQPYIDGAKSGKGDDMKTGAPPSPLPFGRGQLALYIVPVRTRTGLPTELTTTLGLSFVRRSRAMLATPDSKTVLACLVSREYEKSFGKGYWFAFHPHQAEQL